jgi:amidohydrolase
MEVKNLLEDVTQIRRRLHQIPEIAFDLYKTQAVLKEYLTEYGYTFEEVASTGLVAVKKGKSDASIAFRADMDALNVLEQTNVDFKSTHEGKMHACGHDGHMTILLGFAKYLSQLKNLNKSVVLIFQPAEEGPGGSRLIVEEGILKKYKVEAVFGFHLFPALEEEKIGLVDGPMMAMAGEMDITIHGKSAHGAEPHKGTDAIVVASQLVQAYNTIVSRNLDPLESAVVTIGTIQGGEARNIIANTVNLTGTIRTFNPAIYARIKERMLQMNQGLETMYDLKIDMELRDLYPPVINHTGLYQLMDNLLSDNEKVMIKPMMLSEDFSYYQEAVPGIFMMLGSRNEEKGYIHPLHSCYFNFDEKILLKGIETYIRICQTFDIF